MMNRQSHISGLRFARMVNCRVGHQKISE